MYIIIYYTLDEINQIAPSLALFIRNTNPSTD